MPHRPFRFCVLMIGTLLLGPAPAQSAEPEPAAGNPVELGQVTWNRDLPSAATVARQQGKPIFILFQEVPGCLTCQTYGHKVLSHPIIVEAIETLFVPVVIFNNRGGSDAAALHKFSEPAWNNPVVRIVDAEQNDIVPRLSGDYSTAGLVSRLTSALAASETAIPEYVQLLDAELAARRRGTEKTAFGMFCFWTGEGALGRLDGVIATRPGFLPGGEAVEVEFDPAVISYKDLAAYARQNKAGDRFFPQNADQAAAAASLSGRDIAPEAQPLRPDDEPKYYLSHTPLKFLPMTGLQASRVNAAVGARQDALAFLSPRQLALLEVIRRHPDAGWPEMIGRDDLTRAWQETMAVAAPLLNR